jgi:hypothetical protein
MASGAAGNVGLTRHRSMASTSCRSKALTLLSPELLWPALRADDSTPVMLDEQWLRSRLRMAFEIESRDGITDLADGVWRLGDARRQPVVLARSLMRLWAEPSIFDRVRVTGAGIRMIALQSERVRGSPFASGIDWLPLEERFGFYGGRISFIPDPARHRAEEPAPTDPTAPVFRPFSADFRWVTLPDWPHVSRLPWSEQDLLRPKHQERLWR